jgi:hypothetical protein
VTVSNEEVAMKTQVQGAFRPIRGGDLGAGVVQARRATATAAEPLAADGADGAAVSP